MSDIEKAVKLLKTINQNMKVDHMTKDMWEGATEEETREYIEDFGLINLAISALEKQIPKKVKYKTTCPTCNTYNSVWGKRINTKPGDVVYCWHCGDAVKLDWSVEE